MRVRRSRIVIVAAVCLALAGLMTSVGDAAPSYAAAPKNRPVAPLSAHVPAGDEVVTGVGDTAGYHVYAASSGSAWSWLPLATVQPGGYSDEQWVGRQCLTGDGRYVVVVVAPWHATNTPEGMDLGGDAYLVDAHTGAVTPLASGVSLAYFDPGCGAGNQAVLTRFTRQNEAATQVLTVDTVNARTWADAPVGGELTSAVPVGDHVVAVRGRELVQVSGTTVRHLADLPGQPFELYPDQSGGVEFLVRENGTTAGLWRLTGNQVTRQGGGALAGAQLWPGSHGHTVERGIRQNGTSTVAPLATGGGPIATPLATNSTGSVAVSLAGRAVPQPAKGSLPPPGPSVTRVVPAYVGAPVARAQTQAPACAVPRNDPTLQVPQPGPAQVDWAAQLAAQGALTAGRPDQKWGMPVSAPSADFPLPAPFGASQSVPREVVEAVMAQESNWWQASWHVLPGLAGNPLIADYYGYNATGTIDYTQADCGYGIGQITSIMTTGSADPTVQKKVAVDYAENAAATAQALAQKWSALAAAGIVANDGNPAVVENWYLAIWAYNTGLHPNTGSGPWGLGWLNNPINPIYPANRAPFLFTSFDDARHPGDWPYQERVMGWMRVPLGFNHPDYTPVSQYPVLPPVTAFCAVGANQCNPTDTANGFCERSDSECWWHQPATWVPDCPTKCTYSDVTVQPGASEPAAPTNPHPPQCSSTLPSNAVIVDDEPANMNLVGCGSSNWHNGGTFTVQYGTDGSGQPVGEIDWHQLGAGFGGHFWFTHTRQVGELNAVTGTWSPTNLTAGTYNVKVFVPDTGAAAVQATYTISPGKGKPPIQRTIDQFNAADVWVGLGDFTLFPGASVQLSSITADGNDTTDIAFNSIAFVPVSGTIVHHTVDTVAIVKPTQNIDTGLDGIISSKLVSAKAANQWANAETSAAAALPGCSGLAMSSCLPLTVRNDMAAWASSVAATNGNAAQWLGWNNPLPPSPLVSGWLDNPHNYKLHTHLDIDFLTRPDGTIDPGSIDVTGVNLVGTTQLAPFILPFMNAVANDYGVPVPDLTYTAPNLNTYNDVSTTVDLTAGDAPGRSYLPWIDGPALADGNRCLSLAAMAGGADGYKPIVNDSGIDQRTAAWVTAINQLVQRGIAPKVVADTAATIVKEFFHPVDKNLLDAIVKGFPPFTPFDIGGATFTVAPGIWAESHLKLCAGAPLVKPDGGADPSGVQTTVDNSYIPDLYLYVDNKLYDKSGNPTNGPVNSGDWQTFSAPPWQAAPSASPWNTCYIGPPLPLPLQQYPNEPFIARRDGNPFGLHLLDAPGERGNSVFLCDRPSEGTHYDNGQP